MKLKKMLTVLAVMVGMAFALSAEVVLFEPGVTPVKDGEVVTIKGEKYLKIKVNGYNTSFTIPEVDCSKCTTFEVKVFADAEKDWQTTIAVKDGNFWDISNPQVSKITTAPQLASAGFAKKESWNNVSKNKIAKSIQPMLQEKKGWSAQNLVIYIGKITAK
ncbi:MAG: hypothetical protein K6C97_11115 [Treponema sp.]|nr:hypothetical protein [Treponema sp.]